MSCVGYVVWCGIGVVFGGLGRCELIVHGYVFECRVAVGLVIGKFVGWAGPSEGGPSCTVQDDSMCRWPVGSPDVRFKY